MIYQDAIEQAKQAFIKECEKQSDELLFKISEADRAKRESINEQNTYKQRQKELDYKDSQRKVELDKKKGAYELSQKELNDEVLKAVKKQEELDKINEEYGQARANMATFTKYAAEEKARITADGIDNEESIKRHNLILIQAAEKRLAALDEAISAAKVGVLEL